jgi:hypothetical protein
MKASLEAQKVSPAAYQAMLGLEMWQQGRIYRWIQIPNAATSWNLSGPQ